MRCPGCGFENPDGMKFCGECGSPLKRRCSRCEFANPPGFKFCGECGAPLTLTGLVPPPTSQNPALSPQTPFSYTPRHLAERILVAQAALEARAAPDGERKTITALFADIKGSMAMMEDLDPEEARRIIDPALQVMMEAVHRYEGYVDKTTGDGIFALFGAPIAHEDHPQRALYAALRMQEESKRYADKLRREKGVNLQIRVGLNTGEVVVRSIRKDDLHTDYTPIGHSTGLAARMEALATPGSILVTQHTHRLTEGYFQFEALGPAQVKGVAEPIHIYEVLGVGPLHTRLQVAASRGLVRFVGRQREMEQMQRALELAKGGRGQLVAVVGEPGMGKSRLAYEFKLVSQRSCLPLESFSVSHGKASAFLPLVELLKNYLQITLQDDERQRREKVIGRVLSLDRSLEDTLPYLFALLAVSEPSSPLPQMDPQIRRRRTFEAVKRLLLRQSLNQPLLLIFEDLHWLDNETEAFLGVLSDSLATASILLLVNYRPEYQHTWGSKTFYTQLRLDPLGQKEAEELLTALLGDSTELKPVKQLILTKTEGNPFFMEEIVQALVDQGVLVRDPGVGVGGKPTLTTVPLTKLQIPPTVQGVLAARIDRLPAEEKTLLQTLAVIGKEFSFSLLKRVVDQPEDELQRLLSHLQSAEFIYEQPAFPEPEYTFKHSLTQEMAYTSLLRERRRLLHERAAQAIEGLFGDRLQERYRELAHHYSHSGNTEKAVANLYRAGQQAVQQSAYGEAISHLTTGVELLRSLPDTPERARQELTLHINLGAALMATKGYAAMEVEQAYARARELCQQAGETPRLFPVLYGLWGFYVVRAELATARKLGEQLLTMAQRQQEAMPLVVAQFALGQTLFFLAEFAAARDHLEQGIALYDAQKHRAHAFRAMQHPGVSCLVHAALALWVLGFPDQALKRSHEALTLAHGLSHPFSLVYALNFATWLDRFRREGRMAQERAQAVMALSSEHGLVQWAPQGTILWGSALAEQGQVVEGIAHMTQGLAAYRATGANVAQPFWLALLAEAYGKAGQIEEGLSVLDEALAAVDSSGERWCEAELYRLKGELWLNIVDSEKIAPSLLPSLSLSSIEMCFQQAMDLARRQAAKSLELRAAMSLSRLWHRQGKPEEARRLLAETYGWFTEGFDAADLKAAKALIASP